MTEKSSLQVSDEAAAAVATAPRVTLNDINDAIAFEATCTANKALTGTPGESDDAFKLLTLCFIRMKNGYTVIGKSAPASPENFNADLGAKFAREDAVRQIWPIMGYALREKLAA
jgi:hypothetical protein